MQTLFLSENNFHGDSDSAQKDKEKVSKQSGPGGDSEPPGGSKILKLILELGRVALEAGGFAFIIFHLASFMISLWLTDALKPTGEIGWIMQAPPPTGSIISDLVVGLVHAIFLAPFVFIIAVSLKVWPAVFAATAIISGILSLAVYAGFKRPARLSLDLAGVLALVWYAVESK